jgi:hypothetical protein
MPGSTVDVAMEEDRTTLVPGWWLRVVSMLHSVTMCLTMDTWEKLVQFIGTNYGQDISNTKPVHTPEILAHAI